MAPGLIENIRVTGFEMDGDRIMKVKTDQGDIACEKVINCAGQWARQVGDMAGINVPLQPVKHQYIITEKIEGLACRRADDRVIRIGALTSRKRSADWLWAAMSPIRKAG